MPGLVSSLFPAPRFLRCVWRAVPSRCPLSSLAGTPFHAVSAFRGLGLVTLLVFPASLLCVCVRSRSPGVRPPPPLPGLVWRAHPARSRCWALVGPFHLVRAPSRVQPRSRAAFGLLGGGRPCPVSPYLAWGCALPVGWVWAWGPVTNTGAHAPASWPCAVAWRAVGAARGRPGGGRLLPGCGAPGVGRSPTPDHSSFWGCGRGPLPTGFGCGGCGREDPSTSPQRALLRAGYARCGGGMKVPGGGASCLGVGRPGSGALPPPTTRLFGRAAGAHYPVPVGAGGAGVGTCQQPHSARSCELAWRAVGAA